MEDKIIGKNDRAVEHFLLEELVDKKLEIKSLKDENQNLSNGLNAFRSVLISLANRIKVEVVEDGTEKLIIFESISSEKDKELYNVLFGFAKEIGVISNE